jgi:putative transposase
MRSAPKPITSPTARVGACADNAAMESFFSLLQKNVLDRQRRLTRQDLRLATTTWIERNTTAGDGKHGWANSRPSNMKTINRTALTAD